MYKIVPIQEADITSVLANAYPEEKVVHEANCPQYDFYEDNLRCMMADENAYALINNDKTLVLFGIRLGEKPLMWAMPRNDLTEKDKMAYLKGGKKVVREWYKEFGTLYVPLHKEWDDSRKLVYFLGFKKYNDRIAYYDGGQNE